MKHYREQKVHRLELNGKNFSLRDLYFDRCKINNLTLYPPRHVKHRPVVSHCKFQSCKIRESTLYYPFIEECECHDFNGGAGLWIYSGLFSNVALKGHLSNINIVTYSQDVTGLGFLMLNLFSVKPAAFNEENKKQYSNGSISYALDIRGATFSNCQIDGVPFDLIKRDVMTQPFIKSSGADEVKSIDSLHPALAGAVYSAWFEKRDCLALPPIATSTNYDQYLNDVSRLKELGVAY